MQTVSAPASIRDQAMAVIHRRLGPQADQRTLSAAGAEVVCDLLIDLERRFGIDLDPQEAWTFSARELGELVAVKVRSGEIRGWLVANDVVSIVPLPKRPAPLLSRKPIVAAAPTAHAVRAQRMFDREFRARGQLRTIGRLFLLGAVCGAFAALVALGLGLA